jgi:hypothetical protein
MSTSFIPDTYVAPTTTGGGNFTKLQDGANSLRILSDVPLIGYAYWNTAGKPVRSLKHPGQPADIRLGTDNKPEKVKEFWAMAIYNIGTKQVELWEVTQAQIKDAILSLSRDADWGHPTQYSLKITKTGKGIETKYAVMPGKVAPLPADVQAVVDASPVNLMALIDGGNPFDTQPKPGAAPTEEQKKNQADDDNDLPF